MWTIFKVFIEFVTILLLFYVLVFWPRGVWDISSLTRDRTHTPCIGRRSFNHWTAREVPWTQAFWPQPQNIFYCFPCPTFPGVGRLAWALWGPAVGTDGPCRRWARGSRTPAHTLLTRGCVCPGEGEPSCNFHKDAKQARGFLPFFLWLPFLSPALSSRDSALAQRKEKTTKFQVSCVFVSCFAVSGRVFSDFLEGERRYQIFSICDVPGICLLWCNFICLSRLFSFLFPK